MNIKKWYWQTKYRDLIEKLKMADPFEDLCPELRQRERLLECLQRCPHVSWFAQSDIERKQCLYTLASVFAEGCSYAMHKAFWRESDRLTEAPFWKQYLRSNYDDAPNLTYHRDPSTSYHSAVWWSRWPSEMIHGIYQDRNNHSSTLICMADLEREAFLECTLGQKDHQFTKRWLHSFFSLGAFNTSYLETTHDPYTVCATSCKRLNIPEALIAEALIDRVQRQPQHDKLDVLAWDNVHKIASLAKAYDSEYLHFLANFMGVCCGSKPADPVAIAQGHYHRSGEYPSDDYMNQILPKNSPIPKKIEQMKHVTPLVIDPAMDTFQAFSIAWSMRSSYDESLALESLNALDFPTV